MRQRLNLHIPSLQDSTVQMCFVRLWDTGDDQRSDSFGITAAIVTRRSSSLSSFIRPLLFITDEVAR